LVILCIVFHTHSFTQNLVENPSFEELKWCPHLWFDFLTVNDCFKVSGSPDIFNICYNDSSFAGVPANFFGVQYARTGNSYIGEDFGLFYINVIDSTFNDSTFNLAEILGATLKSNLIANKKYCANFYVSLGNRRTNIAMDGISMLFLSDSIPEIHFEPVLDSVLTQYPQMEHPQINNPSGNIIDDTVNWVKVEGEFVANGNEKFIYIGNFKRLNDIHWKIIPAINPYPGTEAYYYIDDVSVYPCDAPVYSAYAGKDTCINSGESVTLGGPSRDEYLYWWSDAERLLDTSGSVTVSPTQTTTYYLVQKDFKFDETRDSVTVTVGNCPLPDYSNLDFEIYPNPCNDIVNIRFNAKIPEGAVLKLYDMIGQEVAQYPLTGANNIATVNLGNFATAVYHAMVVVPDIMMKSVKLVVIH